MNRLKDELKKVIAYDDAFQIVAALSTQGQALQHMYAAISSTPVPKGLKPEELKQYQDGVKGIADPFRVQAIETYKTAVERGQQLQGYNEYLVSAQKNLSNLSGQNSAIYDAKAIITKLPDELSL